jgi:hypothetical protein
MAVRHRLIVVGLLLLLLLIVLSVTGAIGGHGSGSSFEITTTQP